VETFKMPITIEDRRGWHRQLTSERENGEQKEEKEREWELG